MADRAHELTDELLNDLEKRIGREYKKAVKDVQAKLDDYLRRFEIKDKTWRQWVADGIKSEADYKAWRTSQIMVGKRWEEMKDTLAEDLHNENEIAKSIINGYIPEVYAINHNYGVYEVEHGTGLDTSYTLYDRQTVERILRDEPELLPPPGERMKQSIAAGKDIAWQKGQIQSVTLQSILQGESIPNMSKRIAQTLGETNHKSTIRYARTATTGAQNAGRKDAYKRAADMGIEMQEMWVATLDKRTRHEHRQLDGQTVDVGEPYKIDDYDIRFPGDPDAPGYLIWNCRCTTRAVIAGLEMRSRQTRSHAAIDNMTYDEWLEAKEEHRPITYQEDVGNAIKQKYIAEYRRK